MPLKIGDKVIPGLHLGIAALVVIAGLIGGWWLMVEAEGRWNQDPECVANKTAVVELEEDVLAGFKQFRKETAISNSTERIQWLYDQLIMAESELARNPNNPTLKDKVRYLRIQLQQEQQKLDKLQAG